LDKSKARQVIKARSQVISDLASQAKTLAGGQLDSIATGAKSAFGDYLDKEIGRLTRLQSVNPNVRDDEIADLVRMKEQGLSALGLLSVVPDSVRVLVCVKPE
jgi:ATP-dependent helicase HepA